MLTYNLISLHFTTGCALSATACVSGSDQLSQIFDAWADASSHPDFLLHALSYKYTEANLRFEALKGNDRSTIQFAQQQCDKGQCAIYLGLLEREVSGPCADDGLDVSRHFIEQEFENSMKLKQIVNLGGSPWDLTFRWMTRTFWMKNSTTTRCLIRKTTKAIQGMQAVPRRSDTTIL